MRSLAVVTIYLAAAAAIVSAQDDRLPVIRPQLETVKGSPSPFPFPDKTPADYDTWIRTPWIQMNPAKCGNSCVEVSLKTIAGVAQLDTASAKRGPAKLRLGMLIPASCGDYKWYGEIRDQRGSGVAVDDPADNPIELSRIHVVRFDERSREVSMVFQNDHTGSARQARLNVLCKSK
ncbi:MAG TPA: hypothetical protein VFK57_02475 [Vicinamibacterales bacterium]|nr:hypothetical protein [Vicinamibacterales bacterium]